MSRPLRIEYPDAWYHVMNCGRLAEATVSYIYILAAQTPEVNISQSMRLMNGIYTQRYNRRLHCDDQLFLRKVQIRSHLTVFKSTMIAQSAV